MGTPLPLYGSAPVLDAVRRVHIGHCNHHGSNTQEIGHSCGRHSHQDIDLGSRQSPAAAANSPMKISTERQRLANDLAGKENWRRWGPYLSERQWGTVREDYSADGSAWDYLPHDHARSRAYRWSEDGLAGICDRHQYLCFALALWNERDPFLKERLFGLSGPAGNHAEDVKEYYFYLDSTPTHSYMRYLYKYPQAAFPYDQLVAENQRRTKLDDEYELVDTGIFDQGRYFDVLVEYAKTDAEDLLIRVHVCNRGPEPAKIQMLP